MYERWQLCVVLLPENFNLEFIFKDDDWDD